MRAHAANIRAHAANIGAHAAEIRAHAANIRAHAVEIRAHATNIRAHKTKTGAHSITYCADKEEIRENFPPLFAVAGKFYENNPGLFSFLHTAFREIGNIFSSFVVLLWFIIALHSLVNNLFYFKTQGTENNRISNAHKLFQQAVVNSNGSFIFAPL